MTDLTWRQQAEAAFRSALDGVRRVTCSMVTGQMTALGCALSVAEPLIRADERQRVYDELGRDHYVIFTEDRWTIEHSVECRLSGQMHQCAVHRAVDQTFWDTPDPDQLGRWRVTGIDSEGLPDLERASQIGDDHD